MHAMKSLHLSVGSTPGDRRLRYIDALRGIAALLVVWLHVTQTFSKIRGGDVVPGQWLGVVAQDFDVGRIGVVVFFLISGFVIPFSIHPDRPAAICSFAIKRFLRIYPAYWLSIPFSAFATWWLWGKSFGSRDFLVNLTLLQDLFGVKSASGVYWTLFVEIVFYVLCIGLLRARRLYDPLLIGVLAGALVAAHTLGVLAMWFKLPVDTFLVFLPLHLSIMLCGALYRYCLFERSTPPPRARWLLLALLAYYLIVFPAAAIWVRGVVNNYVVADALGFALFILGTTVLRVETRFSDWLGRISYSMYLFHLTIYYPLFWWLSDQPVDSWWRTQHLAVYLLACTVSTIAVASLVNRFVERPCIRLGHRWAERWVQRHERNTQAASRETLTVPDATPAVPGSPSSA